MNPCVFSKINDKTQESIGNPRFIKHLWLKIALMEHKKWRVQTFKPVQQRTHHKSKLTIYIQEVRAIGSEGKCWKKSHVCS